MVNGFGGVVGLQAMAAKVMGAPPPDTSGWAAWIGWIMAAAVAVGAWWNNRRKNDVDESALILGKWKDLVDTHEKRIKEIADEFLNYKRAATEELDSLRSRVRVLERKSMQDDETIRGLRADKEGLQRQLAQVSRSTAAQLGRLRPDPEIDESADKLNRMGDNLREAGSGVPGDDA